MQGSSSPCSSGEGSRDSGSHHRAHDHVLARSVAQTEPDEHDAQDDDESLHAVAQPVAQRDLLGLAFLVLPHSKPPSGDLERTRKESRQARNEIEPPAPISLRLLVSNRVSLWHDTLTGD